MEDYTLPKIKIKKLSDLASIPTRGSEYAAGLDLHATILENVKINPGEMIKIGTGLAMELPNKTFGAIFARSGTATKKGLRPANCVAVIDEDYRGEIIVPLYNDSDKVQTIEPGERIAQLVILHYIAFPVEEVEELTETNRGEGGFGSTGTN